MILKIIFLDIDGVLNGDWSCRRPAIATGKYGLIDESYLGIDPACVERVNRIIRKTGAKIILSTSWVRALGYQETIDFLRWNGLEGEIIGHTPYKMSSSRVNEIFWWLEEHPEILTTKSFVILDDHPSLPHHDGRSDNLNFDDNLISTNDVIGLTDQDAERAIQILNENNSTMNLEFLKDLYAQCSQFDLPLSAKIETELNNAEIYNIFDSYQKLILFDVDSDFAEFFAQAPTNIQKLCAIIWMQKAYIQDLERIIQENNPTQ